MRVRAIRPFRGEEGFVKAKTILEIRDSRARELIGKGLVTPEVGAVTEARAAAAAAANKSLPHAPANQALPAASINKESLQQGAGEATPSAVGGEAAAPAERPTQDSAADLAGIRTGEDNPPSVSVRGRRPRKSRLTLRGAAPE